MSALGQAVRPLDPDSLHPYVVGGNFIGRALDEQRTVAMRATW